MNKTAASVIAFMLLALPAAAQQQPSVTQQGIKPVASAISGPQPVAEAPAVPTATLDRVIPPLARINQIVVAEPNISDSKIIADCKLDIKIIQQNIVKILLTEKLPVTMNASAIRADQVAVTLKPEIAILKDGEVNCISWVSLRAESLYALQLPPLTDRKSVNVALWNRGGLILTPVIDHPAGVGNAFNILSNAFVRQYRLDNPGLMPQGGPALGGLNSLKK